MRKIYFLTAFAVLAFSFTLLSQQLPIAITHSSNVHGTNDPIVAMPKSDTGTERLRFGLCCLIF